MKVCDNCKTELAEDYFCIRWESDWKKRYDLCSWQCVVEFGKKKGEIK